MEAALVLPIFLFGVITLISFMDIYKVQTEHLTELCQKAKEAGMYAYGAGNSGAENIVLPDVYSCQPVGGLLPLPRVWFHNTVKVHAWTGVKYEEKTRRQKISQWYMSQSQELYITENWDAAI